VPDVGVLSSRFGGSEPPHQVKREEIFITTKIPGPIGADAVQKMVLEETLPKLGVDYVLSMHLCLKVGKQDCLGTPFENASCIDHRLHFLLGVAGHWATADTFWILESSPPELKLQNCSACTFLFFDLTPTALPMFPKVDLLLIHFPCVDQQDFPNACGSKGRKERLDTWHGITQLRKNGKVRAIGAF